VDECVSSDPFSCIPYWTLKSIPFPFLPNTIIIIPSVIDMRIIENIHHPCNIMYPYPTQTTSYRPENPSMSYAKRKTLQQEMLRILRWLEIAPKCPLFRQLLLCYDPRVMTYASRLTRLRAAHTLSIHQIYDQSFRFSFLYEQKFLHIIRTINPACDSGQLASFVMSHPQPNAYSI
jgi:hypothetical protein